MPLTSMLHRSTWCLLLLIAAVGCEDGASGDLSCDLGACPEDCTRLAGSHCDVLEADCQQRVFSAVECVRGTPGELPMIRTLTETALEHERDQKAQAQEGDAGMGDAGVPGEDAVEAVNHWDRGLRLLGLRSPTSVDADDESLEVLAGYYDSGEQQITLIDRGRPQDSAGSESLLAHELVHALQDQTVGLAETYRSRRTTDARLALGCLVEGEAMLYEELAVGLLRGLPVDAALWDRYYERRGKGARAAVANAESPDALVWTLRYSVGGRFLTDAWLSGGNAAAQGLHNAPPANSLQWMRGYDDSRRPAGALSEPLHCNRAVPPAGYSLWTQDTQGALVVYAMLAHTLREDGVADIAQHWQNALGWRQDSLTIFSNEQQDTAVSWRIRFDDADRTSDLAARLDRAMAADLRVYARDEELEIIVSSVPLSGWTGTPTGGCMDAD